MGKDKRVNKLSPIIDGKDKKISTLSPVTNDNELDEGYDDLELLERLESLREDMEDLGIHTLDELIKRIDDLHERLDAK